MFSYKSITFIAFSFLIYFVVLSSCRSIESRADMANKFPSFLKESPDQQKNPVDSEIVKEVKHVADDPIKNFVLKGVGVSIGKLEKRKALLNITSIESLLDFEVPNSPNDKDERNNCSFEIKISKTIKIIPGRCAFINHEFVCRHDNFYMNSDECAKAFNLSICAIFNISMIQWSIVS